MTFDEENITLIDGDNGNIYYLSQSGDDKTGKLYDEDDGTIFPFKTMQAAIDAADKDRNAHGKR